jgi:uncharacterized protein (TIGR02145 family)
MKQKFYTLRAMLMVTLASLLISSSLWAQSPQRLSYQAVVRNSSSALVTSTQVGMQVSILQGSLSGTVVYTETLTPTTNTNGLVTVDIGGGNGFDAINWAAGPYFIRVETDPTGGSNYTIIGESQLLSVPYALHAKTAETFIETFIETDPLFTIWDKATGISITESQISNQRNYVETETQSLADVAAIGNVVNNQLKNLTNPTDAQDVATKTFADSKLTELLARIQVLENENIATLPTVSTNEVTAVSQTTANAGGEVTLNGGASITARGLVWSPLQNPTLTINEGKTTNGTGLGVWLSELTNLTPKTSYFIRAYATNKVGTAYGNQIEFTTLPFNYTLSLESNPIEGGSTTGAGDYEEGDAIVLTATANTGYAFENWTLGADVINTEANFTYTMPAASISLTANFELIPTYTLNLVASPTEGGTVIGAGEYTEGAAILLTATPNEGYTFASWTLGSDVISSEANFTYTMPAASISLTANFELIPKYTLNLVANPTEGGIITGAGEYFEGAAILLTATPNEGFTFASWTLGAAVISTEANFTYTLPAANVTLAANFAEKLVAGTVTDIDGNVYPTVVIGNQLWMAKNLRTTKYNNSLPIPNYTLNTEWNNPLSGAYCWYNNDEASNKDTYGALYNGYAVQTGNLCPTGWHIPTDAEWYTMENFVDPTINNPDATYNRGTNIGAKLKATSGWNSGGNGTDVVGFAALPGGERNNPLNFQHAGGYGKFWTSSDKIDDANYIWMRQLAYDGNLSWRWYGKISNGQSVRCIKNTGLQPTTYNLTLSTIPFDGGTVAGEGVYVANADIQLTATASTGYTFVSWTLRGNVISTDINYTYSMPSSNEVLVANFKEVITGGSVTDIDGNVYPTIEIGTQEWMAKNLRTTKYNDGTPILTLNYDDWKTTTQGAYAIYPHIKLKGYYSDAEVLASFGALYNGYSTANGNLCPTGWRIPTSTDLDALQAALGFNNVGGKLKSTRTVPDSYPSWDSPNTGATNETGFNALPGGFRYGSSGDYFPNIGFASYWRTSSYYTQWYLYYNSGYLSKTSITIRDGLAVRCVREVQPKTYTLSLATSPTNGGTTTGTGEYTQGTAVQLTATPNAGYTFVNWTLGADVVSVEANFTYTMPATSIRLTANFELIPTYTLNLLANPTDAATLTGAGDYEEGVDVQITATPNNGFSFLNWTLGADVISTEANFTYTMPSVNTSLTANFEEKLVNGTVTDIDGNVYPTVVIGNQLWMAENLKTTKFRNGDPITNGSSLTNSQWYNRTTEAYTVYPNAKITGLNSDAEVIQAYGLLYNWYALGDTRGLCPTGWHVPTSDQWITLIDFVGGWSIAGGKIKSTRTAPDAHPRWDSPNYGAIDNFGFNALPGGYRSTMGFDNVGLNGYWWSTKEENSTSAWVWNASKDGYNTSSYYFPKFEGKSIRCLKNSSTQPITLSLSASPTEGGSVSGAGNFLEGDRVQIIATPNSAYRFVNWTNGSVVVSTSATYTYTMPATSVELTANFQLIPTYSLSVVLNPAESGTITGLGNYPKDAVVALKAIPNEGYSFVNWTNGATVLSNSANYSYTMPANNVTLTANFINKVGGTVNDVEGNTYITVVIGTQKWMAENLKTTKYNDGTDIPNVTANAEWSSLKTDAYAWYNNDAATYKDAYGALYNWYAVGKGNLCPTGWHVPSNVEWTTLINYVGGQSIGGNLLKSTRTKPEVHPRWESTTTSVTNATGFSGLPGGYKDSYGSSSVGFSGYWWSTTPYSTDYAYWRGLSYSGSSVTNTMSLNYNGYSVRCLED